MHMVLQQNYIGGKNCLVEEQHREALMDILNLLSEKAQSREEAEAVPAQKHEELPEIAGEEQQEAIISEAELISKEEQTGEEGSVQEEQMEDQQVIIEEGVVVKADVGEAQEMSSGNSEDDCGKVPIWYYCPNGSLIKR
ncbi:MAG: hypothetical protein WDA53_09340 [Bacillota bacterium]